MLFTYFCKKVCVNVRSHSCLLLSVIFKNGLYESELDLTRVYPLSVSQNQIAMADRPTTLAATNGIALEEEDTFERDLKEMLQDGPAINDYNSTLQLGSTHSAANVDLGSGVQRSVPTSLSATAVPRSFTSPNGK